MANELPPALAPKTLKVAATDEETEIVETLVSYKSEAQMNRASGPNPRDQKWTENLDLYFNRHNFADKADWQAQEVMPEVPSYVDRFSAAMKEALVSSPNGFYVVEDPYDAEHDLTNSVKAMNDVWLSICGENQLGTPLGFESVFEDQIKQGALTACCGMVTWKTDVPGGRVAVDTIDPQQVWLDTTGRNLYRIRQTEIDKADLARMKRSMTQKGESIYNIDEIERMLEDMDAEAQARKERQSGSSLEVTSDRCPIMMDEYVASVVGSDGELLMDNEMVLLANDKYILRGPEKNPFWHKHDWMFYSPLITVPNSVYGRSYMEDFGSIARVFTDLTNLILDATYTASMNVWAVVPSMLEDPSQLNTGFWPNKLFRVQDGYDAKEFAQQLTMGTLPAGAVQIWQAIKGELSEAAGMNEIGLGQLPNKTHIAATAVAGAQQSSSAMLRSVAQTIETRVLDLMLNMMWKVGVQHLASDDRRMIQAVGEQTYRGLYVRRKELVSHPYTFQARGISGLIQRQQRLQATLQVLQVVAQDQNLMAAFMQRVDVNKMVNLLFYLSNVDLTKIEKTQRDMLMEQVGGPLAQMQNQGNPSAVSGGAQQEMGQVAQMMGVAR